MLYTLGSLYQTLIGDQKLVTIINELNRHAHRVTKTFEQLCDELSSYEEEDNEMNRITGRYKIDGSYYISALLFYTATKGWTEPTRYLIENGVDIRLIVLNDDTCTQDKIKENVSHFFDVKLFKNYNNL